MSFAFLLLVNADGIDRQWLVVVLGIGLEHRNILVINKHFTHLSVKLRIHFFKIITNSVGLNIIFAQNVPNRCLDSFA